MIGYEKVMEYAKFYADMLREWADAIERGEVISVDAKFEDVTATLTASRTILPPDRFPPPKKGI